MKTFKTACFDRPLHCLASKSRSRNARESACLGVKTGFIEVKFWLQNLHAQFTAFQLFLVQWFHQRNHRTKKNSAPRAKFRLVENRLNTHVLLKLIFPCLKLKQPFDEKGKSALAEHVCYTKHEVAWENSKVITTNNRYGQRLCLEA
jgi:hypothetical protein